MLPVIVKDQAISDIQSAYDFLEGQKQKLGEKLLTRIEEYIEIIETNPLLFKAGYRQIRQVRIKPFQYVLRYKVYKDYTAIIQLFHGKLHPKKRLKE